MITWVEWRESKQVKEARKQEKEHKKYKSEVDKTASWKLKYSWSWWWAKSSHQAQTDRLCLVSDVIYQPLIEDGHMLYHPLYTDS